MSKAGLSLVLPLDLNDSLNSVWLRLILVLCSSKQCNVLKGTCNDYGFSIIREVTFKNGVGLNLNELELVFFKISLLHVAGNV